jgi:hypothetical protein
MDREVSVELNEMRRTPRSNEAHEGDGPQAETVASSLPWSCEQNGRGDVDA